MGVDFKMSTASPDAQTRNRSDSAGDSDQSQHERKRPRLSAATTEEQTRQMPNGNLSASTRHTPEQGCVSNNMHVRGTPPLVSTEPILQNIIASPTSKVTINTRPLSSQSRIHSVIRSGATSPLHNKSTTSVVTTDGSTDGPRSLSRTVSPQPGRQDGSQEQDTISISSSNEDEPEIEIADVEEYDDDPSATRWTTRSARTNLNAGMTSPSHILRTFPFSNQNQPGHASGAIKQLQKAFQNGAEDDGVMFQAVQEWLTDFTDNCERMSASLLAEDPAFWQSLPDLTESLLRRELGVPTKAEPQDLIEYFIGYGRLTCLMMDYDIQTLEGMSSEKDPKVLKDAKLVSPAYVLPFSWSIQIRTPFYEALQRMYNLNFALFIEKILKRLVLSPGSSIIHMSFKLLEYTGRLLSHRSPQCKLFLNLLSIAECVASNMDRLLSSSDVVASPPSLTIATELESEFSQIMLIADSILTNAVEKQLPWLNMENARQAIESLAPLVRRVGVWNPEIGRAIFVSTGVAFTDTDATHFDVTLDVAWKFKTLLKFIKSGRMELRVCGAEVMSADLVAVFHKYIKEQPDGGEHPLVQLLVRFIQENELVKYIVGVDSHAQLIQRGHNIGGFLCVTSWYADTDTDNIWRAVLEGQDPRTTAEVLTMLQRMFQMYEIDAFHYICQKIAELPFDRYDMKMHQFTACLLEAIWSRAATTTLTFQQSLHSPPRQLCIRLLREASTPSFISSDVSLSVRRDILPHLQSLSRATRVTGSLLAENTDEAALLQNIRSDLQQHNDYVSGDIQIVTCASQQLPHPELVTLLQSIDFVTLFVEDIALLSEEIDRSDEKAVQVRVCEFEVRLVCLFYLVTLIPAEIGKDLVESLWISLYSCARIPEVSRTTAWNYLAKIMQQCQQRNVFIDHIITDCLPRLHPRDYSLAVLDFAEQSVQYEINFPAPKTDTNCDDAAFIPGIERIWKFVLEALPNTVESPAIDFIIKQYLDNPIITKCNRSSIDMIHSSLVDRSVEQVIRSATKLQSLPDGVISGQDDAMVMSSTQTDVQVETQHFDRSLLFLRRLLEGLRARPQYSPVQNSACEILPEFPNKRGALFDFHIQLNFNSSMSTSPLRIAAGEANTGSELWQYIAAATKLDDFRAFHLGQRVDWKNEASTLSDLKIASAMVLIGKAPNMCEPHTSLRTSPITSVDEKVLNHFESLYKLLDTDARLAGEVYNFLSLFPAQSEILSIIRSKTRSARDLLPSSKPFKSLYTLRAVRTCVEVESFSNTPDTTLLVYSVHTITEALSALDNTASENVIHQDLKQRLIECLLLGFRARVSSDVSHAYIQNPCDYITHLLYAWETALEVSSVGETQSWALNSIRRPFDALLEGALHDVAVLDLLKANTKFPALLRYALLKHENTAVHGAVAEVIFGLTGGVTKSVTKNQDSRIPKSRFTTMVLQECLKWLWNVLKVFVAGACSQVVRSQAFFDTATAVMKQLAQSFAAEEMQSCFQKWSILLLQHEPVERIGQPVSDCVMLNLPKLLLECATILSAASVVLCDSKLVSGLFSQYLYPPFSISGQPQASNMPTLDTNIRQNLFDLVLALSPTAEDVSNLIPELEDDLLPTDTFELGVAYERLGIRSETGYSGLRNLSNTCYLNSLLSQLFMNVEFRDFIIGSNVIDERKQRLVLEMGKVFANMQSSYEKSIDPSCAVDSIITYDGDQIDVAVQMDVDEFFNLLFDRLEGQIVDPQRRQQFKSMYGGQLVQQVKSRECDHISERLEPFSAVQVEIKGKQTLQDSLKAYVEGEVLQGENKYSCTSCGRHVDAVKRACLKDVPNNLIFNLKRFDYDIMTGTRCKVNDEFQFPETLDISPFTLDHLSQSGETIPPDLFELTGIIVHSGTADSGHYYSFIRQRPSAKLKKDAWVQFNDQDVSQFDPAQIQDCCYGGTDTSSAYYMAKFYSAYMLFYQRVGSIQQMEGEYILGDPSEPTKVSLSDEMEAHLIQQNELFLRTYCVQDPSHALFVRRLLERIHNDNSTELGENHHFETKVLKLSLNYVFHISSRWKGLPEFEDTLAVLGALVTKCCGCAGVVLRWFAGLKMIEGTIIRNPYQLVRKGFASLLCLTLSRLHQAILQDGSNSSASAVNKTFCMTITQYEDNVEHCLANFARLWDNITKVGRAWPEYFQVLQHCLTRLGDEEALILIEQGFLEKALEIIWIHCPLHHNLDIPRRFRARYSFYLAAREKGRVYTHGLLVRFIANILQRIDFSAEPSDRIRQQHRSRVSLSSTEFELLGLGRNPSHFEWLRRMIIGNSSPSDIQQIIAHFSRHRKLTVGIFCTVNTGLNDKNIATASLFLQPAITYAENCSDVNRILDLAQGALEGVATISLEYGREYLEFIAALLMCENHHANVERGWLKDVVLDNVNNWAPPLLIAPNDAEHDIKKETIHLLQRLLFEPIYTAQTEDRSKFRDLQSYVHKFMAGAQEYLQVNIFDVGMKSDIVVLPTQALALSQVMEHCIQYYDMHDPAQHAKAREMESCLNMLRTRAEITTETLSAAEWPDDSSDVAELSEAEVEEVLSP